MHGVTIILEHLFLTSCIYHKPGSPSSSQLPPFSVSSLTTAMNCRPRFAAAIGPRLLGVDQSYCCCGGDTLCPTVCFIRLTYFRDDDADEDVQMAQYEKLGKRGRGMEKGWKHFRALIDLPPIERDGCTGEVGLIRVVISDFVPLKLA